MSSGYTVDASDPKAVVIKAATGAAAEDARVGCSFAPVGNLDGFSMTINIAVHKDAAGKIGAPGKVHSIGENLKYSFADNSDVHFIFDSTAPGRPSASGKTTIMATTGGWKKLEGTRTAVNLNIMRSDKKKDAKKADAPASVSAASADAGPAGATICGPFHVIDTDPKKVELHLNMKGAQEKQSYRTDRFVNLPGDGGLAITGVVFARLNDGKPFEHSDNFTSIGDNFEARYDEPSSTVIFRFDSTVEGTPSSTGKSNIVAGTTGWGNLGKSKTGIKLTIIRSTRGAAGKSAAKSASKRPRDDDEGEE